MARFKLRNLFWISGEDTGEVEGESAPEERTPSAPPRTSEPPRASTVPASVNPSDTVEAVLATLREVDGVVGSIAARTGGTVVGYDLPRAFDRATAEGAARQMSLLAAALATEAGRMKTGTLRFCDFHFHVDEFPSGLIGILAADRTDRPALRMAVRVVGRRIETTLSGRSLRPGSSAATR